MVNTICNLTTSFCSFAVDTNNQLVLNEFDLLLSAVKHFTDADIQHVKVTSKFRAGQDWKEMYATSTAKGNYQFKGIPNGKCTVSFELKYYETLTKDIAVYSEKVTELNITIKRVIH